MSSPLSLWQELALLILGLLALCYALLFRIWQTQALVADGVFALAIAALVLVVAVPSSFDLAGVRLVEGSPLPEALGHADERAAALAALPGRLIDSALARIGFEPDEEEMGATPEAHVEAIARDAPAKGWLSEQVRPSVDGLVALLVRIATGTTASLVAVLDAPASACDGQDSTAWLAGADDALPSLRFELARPVRAERLVLGQAGSSATRARELDRLQRVEVVVNGEEPIVVELDPDPRRPHELDLGRRRRVRTLELRILESAPGARYPGARGFSEVALLARAGQQ